VDHALAFLLPIASALQHAHDAGVLHRDLKPANIFLARDVRDDVVPTLLDFGLSKSIGGMEEHALTSSELVAGTVLYMAPEQTVGVRMASPASDQYSLAAVLYEAITGFPPFVTEGSVYELIERVRTTTPRAPSLVREGIPAAIDGVILRAMSHDPAARFESVRAFARELLPLASEDTRIALERDFAERTSEGGVASTPRGSSPSVRRASARTQAAGPTEETRADLTPQPSQLRAGARLPCPAGTSPFHIKGVFYRGLVENVKATIGLDALCDSLDDESLRTFTRQTFLASTRYDVLPFLPLSNALARAHGVSLDAFVRSSTTAQARYDSKHVYKLIFDSAKPEDVATRVGRFNSQIYDFGEYTGHIPSPNHVVVEYAFIPKYLAPWFGPMHAAYADETLRLTGAKDVTLLSHVVTDAGEAHGVPLISFRSELRWR
jgi:serine/threonine protein kinase